MNEFNKQKKSLHPININKVDKESIRKYFLNTWNLTEYLFSSIKSSETYYLSPDSRRNPLVFYYGHVAAFYINKLKLSGLINEDIDADLEYLFSVGVDPKNKNELGQKDWIALDKVVDFREKVFEIVLSLIETNEIPLSISSENSFWALLMAIEHERIHFETSSVLIRQCDVNLVEKPSDWEYCVDESFHVKQEFLKIEGAEINLGRSKESNMFGWDNEYGSRKVFVNSFMVSNLLITNSEFLYFVQDGGYNHCEYWSTEGWDWITEQKITHPEFWVKTENNYKLRTIFDVIDMPKNWPVEVIAHEAEAFCNWKGKEYRLLTESEWKLLTNSVFHSIDKDFQTIDVNTNLIFLSPTPVGYLGGKPPFDIMGNVWEIISDDFSPLDGFSEHQFYKDFSSPYFDSQHGMMLGGSWASTGESSSRYYRLWFRRDFIQHAGFRLVLDI